MTNLGATVVVPTLNRHETLLNCLNDLTNQSYSPIQILIVDQSEHLSSDIDAICQLYPDLITWCRVTFKGLPLARNYGWHHAQYEVIIFVDDDVRCGPTFVAEHVRALQLPHVGVVAGGIDQHSSRKSKGPTGSFKKWTASTTCAFDAYAEGDVSHAQGCNFSVWKHVLVQLGGIDESLAMGSALYEETDFCLRAKEAGFRIYFNGHARLTHLAAPSGGCRVADSKAYIFGLAHNRAIIISKHLRWYHIPTAVARFAAILCAYTLHYRSIMCIVIGAKGFLRGWNSAMQVAISNRKTSR